MSSISLAMAAPARQTTNKRTVLIVESTLFEINCGLLFISAPFILNINCDKNVFIFEKKGHGVIAKVHHCFIVMNSGTITTYIKFTYLLIIVFWVHI